MKTLKKKKLLQFAAVVLAVGLSTFSAMASPPSPDADPSCGGDCQAICINGCDTKQLTFADSPNATFTYAFSWTQARCILTTVGPNGNLWWRDLAAATHIQGTLKSNMGGSCMDGYNCDFGPCGEDGQRACSGGYYQCPPCDGATGMQYDAASAKCKYNPNLY